MGIMSRQRVRLRHVVMLSSALIPNVSVAGTALWNGAEAGMTIEQVRSLFPAARGPEEFSKGHPAFVVDGVQLGESDIAQARLVFTAGKLSFVNLDLQNLEGHTKDSNVGRMKSLKDRLSIKYGAPLICTEDPDAYIYQSKCEWRVGLTDITLSFIEVADQLPIIVVLYRAAEGSPTKGL